MSYDLYLVDPATGATMQAAEAHNIAGGTYALGGTTEAHFNITYNYGSYFSVLGENGIRSINGMTGADSVPLLETAAGKLHGEPSSNYWEPSEGNAKRALLDTLRLARMFPCGVWEID